ncbi:hypothetical protein JRQ81_006332 [Phrynocephalus forsythii]|uniref:Uncharacterized protein n=1 Tax=Phrynocephalus forsythii TaxID=171643 RepID=A0A9Q0XF86_9SAUR|nr:hypothetical protein JRQ81_006332 [Phrynocephalus forsythii]
MISCLPIVCQFFCRFDCLDLVEFQKNRTKNNKVYKARFCKMDQLVPLGNSHQDEHRAIQNGGMGNTNVKWKKWKGKLNPVVVDTPKPERNTFLLTQKIFQGASINLRPPCGQW